MSAKEVNDIRATIARRLKESAAGTFLATVESIDEEARTCRVKAEEVVYDDVRLYAVQTPGKPGFCFLPAEDSFVLVSRIGGSNELMVTMFSEIDKVLLTIGEEVLFEINDSGLEFNAGDTTLTTATGGFTLTRAGSGLKKTLDDLITAICQLTVTTGVGPSGVPINIADFQKIKQGLSNYLEG